MSEQQPQQNNSPKAKAKKPVKRNPKKEEAEVSEKAKETVEVQEIKKKKNGFLLQI